MFLKDCNSQIFTEDLPLKLEYVDSLSQTMTIIFPVLCNYSKIETPDALWYYTEVYLYISWLNEQCMR